MPVNPVANVYVVALLLSVASGLLFGAVPVKQVLRTDAYQIIKSGSTGALGRRITARDVLLCAQIAICAVLVTSSMVAVRGLARSLRSNYGFEPRNAMLVDTDLNMAGYSGDLVPAMQKRMIDAMQAIPDVTSVALVNVPPLQPACCVESSIFTDATSDLRPSNIALTAITFSISPEYLHTARTSLLAGRDLTSRDDKNAPRVALVNRLFADKIFGSATNALGRYYKVDNGTRIQVVGVVEDGKYSPNITEELRPAAFLPLPQSPNTETWLIVRSSGNPRQLAAALRTKLRDLDSGLPFFIQTWNEAMDGALFPSRMAALSLGVLGVMGAMLAATGIFGMAAYSVSKRLREFGIRMAVGAQRKDVLRAALGRPFKLLAIGSTAGLLLGILASRVLAFIVYQATPRDPLVLVCVALAMALLGLVATWIPAERALSVEPMTLLREQ
jgi:predicted permease